jgi:hypothetical protein
MVPPRTPSFWLAPELIGLDLPVGKADLRSRCDSSLHNAYGEDRRV